MLDTLWSGAVTAELMHSQIIMVADSKMVNVSRTRGSPVFFTMHPIQSTAWPLSMMLMSFSTACNCDWCRCGVAELSTATMFDSMKLEVLPSATTTKYIILYIRIFHVTASSATTTKHIIHTSFPKTPLPQLHISNTKPEVLLSATTTKHVIHASLSSTSHT